MSKQGPESHTVHAFPTLDGSTPNNSDLKYFNYHTVAADRGIYGDLFKEPTEDAVNPFTPEDILIAEEEGDIEGLSRMLAQSGIPLSTRKAVVEQLVEEGELAAASDLERIPRRKKAKKIKN